jgi:hypothetical protein
MSKTTAKEDTPEEWQKRFNAAAEAAMREYCDMFEFWRDCRYKPCRKQRQCRGDARVCIKRCNAEISYEAGNEAHARLYARTPPDAGPQIHTARCFSPHCFACW